MRTSHHSFDEPAPFEANDPRISETQEDVIDRVGIRLAMLVLCIAGFIAALSVLSTPSFEKCTVLTSVSERYALRGTAGGFFKTSHAVTSEARASSSSVQGACDGAAEKAEALDRLPAKRAPMLVLPSLSASRAQLWAY